MKTLLGTITLALTLSGCAGHSSKPAPASNEEISRLTKHYMTCLVPYASRLDDGMSDAKTIASGMDGACPDEYAAMMESITRADNDAVRKDVLRKKSQIQADIALKVVLDLRSAKKNKP